MTKEEYLVFRNTNSAEPLYIYYLEHAKENILSREDFVRLIQQWPGVMEALNTVYDHYDRQFEITRVTDLKTGQLIKCT